MALTANLIRSTISADGSSSTWTDSTTYSGANPDRDEVAVYLTAYKVDEDLVETSLTVTTFDPEVDSTFITDNGSEDGWVKYNFVIIDNWLVGTTYTKYDLVWSTSQNKFYEYINASNTAGHAVTEATYFNEVTDPTSKIANVGTSSESGNLIYQVINKVLTFQTSICYIKAQSLKAKECCASDDCNCDSRLTRLATKIRDLFAVLPLNESTGQFLEGEKNARLVEKYCSDCGCLDR